MQTFMRPRGSIIHMSMTLQHNGADTMTLQHNDSDLMTLQHNDSDLMTLQHNFLGCDDLAKIFFFNFDRVTDK